jgi:hypothetical protein
MAILDAYMPVYQFAETHSLVARAPADLVLDAVEAFDVHEDGLLRALLALREAPSRLLGALGLPGALKDEPRFGLANFTRLARSENEVVYGLVGRFWRPSFGLIPIPDPAAFLATNATGAAKLTMAFVLTPEADGALRLVTETRVYCPDRSALLSFAPYWLLIRAASGLVRRRVLAAVARKAEAAAAAKI